MLLTLGQAIQELAQYCGAGKYPEDETVPYDINEAIERLMNKPKNWTNTIQNLIMCAPNGQLTMPREVLKIIKARVNGSFSTVQSRWFEYMSNGPGLLEKNKDWLGPMEDRGFACTQYDIPQGRPMKLLIVSDREEDDIAARLLIRGHDETGREVYGKNLFGEYVPIRGGTQDQAWVTEHTFSDIMSIQKPITRGYVYISAVDLDTGERYFMGSIHPDETEPNYRRYFIQECGRPDTTSTITQNPRPYRIDAICKLRYVSAVHESDILLIQNRGAIKMMLKALRFENTEKIDEAQKYEATAERLLNEQTENTENAETMIEVDQSFASLSRMRTIQ